MSSFLSSLNITGLDEKRNSIEPRIVLFRIINYNLKLTLIEEREGWKY